MSLISKLFVKFNPTNILHVQKMVIPNFINEMRRNISKRFTIGKDCNPKEPEECPKVCRKIKKPSLPTSVECLANKKCDEDKTKPIKEFRKAKHTNKNKEDTIADETDKKSGQYVTPECDPFASDGLKKKLLKCKSVMRHPCDLPPAEHKCSLTKGKMLYTTNERPAKTLPKCPKGNWKYTDQITK